MVAGYNLRFEKVARTFKECLEFDKYVEIGENHLKGQKARIKENIEQYIINGVANGTQIAKDWFPEIEADIFISHSHADEKLAKGLAGWLFNSFNLKCFIDSCVWGYADDLLEQINEEYSDKKYEYGGCTYNHQKCNMASKHVNTMLTIALHKMIDKAEVTILLNTQNSISKYNEVYNDATYSPWIYSEIICTEIVRKKCIFEYRDQNILENYYFEKSDTRTDGFTAAYGVSLDHLEDLDFTILRKWKNLYDKKKIVYPLDYLYNLTYPEETKHILFDKSHSREY